MKNRIRDSALKVFDEKGFYQTGIRDIAHTANCSLPTLYYYFKNKEALFECAVCDTYEELVMQIEEQLPEGVPLLDRYYFEVLQRQLLPESQKLALRIALKMFLGVDGFPAARDRLNDWERKRLDNERAILRKDYPDPLFANVVLRVVDNMLQRSILFGEELRSENIRTELGYLLK